MVKNTLKILQQMIDKPVSDHDIDTKHYRVKQRKNVGEKWLIFINFLTHLKLLRL